MRVALAAPRPAAVRLTVVCLALVSLAAASACDVPGAPPESALDLYELPVLTLHEDLRLGSLEDDREGFSQIVGIEVDAAGRLYVLEGAAGVPEVRIYAPDGALLHRAGGRGDGPGEFARPAEMGLMGDTFWVRDAVHRRITFFAAADGTLRRTVPTPQVAVESGDPSVRASVVGARPLPGGGFEGRPEIFFMGPLEVDSVDFPRVRFHPEGGGADTVGWQRLPAGAHQILFEGIPILVSPPLADPPIRIPLADPPIRIPLDDAVPEEPTDTLVVERRAAASPDDGLLRVVLVWRDGSPADTVLRLRYPPLPVPAGFADSLARVRVATVAPLGLDTVAARRVVRDALEVGDFHPPVRAHRLGADGAVWLDLVYAEASDGTEGADDAWLVLEPDGTVRGLIVLEPGVRILWSNREWAWALERDALDVPWLIRYRLLTLQVRRPTSPPRAPSVARSASGPAPHGRSTQVGQRSRASQARVQESSSSPGPLPDPSPSPSPVPPPAPVPVPPPGPRAAPPRSRLRPRPLPSGSIPCLRFSAMRRSRAFGPARQGGGRSGSGHPVRSQNRTVPSS